MAHSSGYDYELESKINEMSTYLDRLVVGEEKDYHFDPDCASSTSAEAYGTTDFRRRTPPLSYIPRMPLPIAPVSVYPQNYGIPTAGPSQCSLTNVTSALATRLNSNNSTLRFVNPAPHSRTRKWGNYKQLEKEPDTSNIDIRTTMAELGLTPESLTNNEVYRLFSKYNKLAFYINAEYISENIYDGRTLPNTMSASAQTRHAIWSSNKLLRQLREALKKHTHVPSEYQVPLAECKQSLEELHMSILNLETYKFCVLEHRRGKFISVEARANLEPLMESLNQVIECVGKSRMYIQIIDWALSKGQQVADTICDGPSQPLPPLPEEGSLQPPANGRPTVARRYIG